jgi:hypothetical protein
LTASAELRRRYTQRAAVAIGVAFVLAVLLAVIGARTLASSTIGTEAGDESSTASVALPDTTTAFVGITDDSGVLQSAVLVVVDPSGVGGAIVPFEGAADISSGRADSVIPLRDALETSETKFFALDAESITGLTFDFIDVVSASELDVLLGLEGEVALDLPQSAVLKSEASWVQGRSTASVAEATELLASGGELPYEVGADIHLSVWGSLVALANDSPKNLPESEVESIASIDEVFAALFAGDIEMRALNLYEVDGSDGMLVYYDWAETLLVASHLAPSHVAAPYESAVVRVLVPFEENDVLDTGYSVSDIAVIVVRRLTDAGLNVVSVSTGPNADVEKFPDVTEVWTGDESTVSDAAGAFSELLGEVVAREGDYSVDGIDIVITLGSSFLNDLEREIAADLTAWPASTAGG